jgi:uncharacterized protein
MLVFDLRTLVSTAAHVDDTLPLDDAIWDASDRRPTGPIRVSGRLSSVGASGDRFYFSGRINGETAIECRRCLTETRVTVDEPLQALFLAVGSEASDDPDVVAFDPRMHTLDLRPAVREAWLLGVPLFVLCREDCPGLVPTQS